MKTITFQVIEGVDKGRVYVVDLVNAKVRGVAQTGSFPQGIVVSNDGRYVYTVDTGSNSVTEIDTVRLKRTRSIAVSVSCRSRCKSSKSWNMSVPNAGCVQGVPTKRPSHMRSPQSKWFSVP